MAEHREQARVAWVDTDAGGRIHFTAAFRWAEVAETGLFRKLGLLAGGQYGNYPRRHVEADYLQVLVFEDELDVHLRVVEVGRTSIRFVWEISRGGEVAVSGTHTIVHVDDEGRPAAVDERTRAALLSG
jgi:YbgC/YbaW family acyl-CoA thioester hydrolase